jgi:hypothetical protein
MVRNMKDLIDLAGKNSITLTGNSGISDKWNEAIDAYLAGNFKGAKKQFDAMSKDYPENYLAASLSQLAAERIGSADDQSGQYESKTRLIYGLSIIAFILVALAAAVVVIVRRHHRQHPKYPGTFFPTQTLAPPPA